MDVIENQESVYFGPFQLSKVKRTLWRGTMRVPLTPTEFEVLLALVESQGQPLAPEAIIEKAWHGLNDDLNNAHQVIRRLRKKLAPDGNGHELIPCTKAGYVLTTLVIARPHSESNEDVVQVATNLAPSGTAQPSLAEPERQAKLVPRRLLPILIAAIFVAVIAFLAEQTVRRSKLVLPTTQITRDGRPKVGPLLFDGKRLWFREAIHGKWQVVNVVSGGGETKPLDVPFKQVRLLASSNSSLLLASQDDSEEKFWLWSLAGAPAQLLSPEVAESAWSPDHQFQAVGRKRLLNIFRGTSIQKFDMPVSSYISSSLSWSPDSRRLAFELANDRTTLHTMMLFSPFSGFPRPIDPTQGAGPDQLQGSWTKDSQHYIFSAGSTDLHDLWAVRNSNWLGTSGPVRLTNGPIDWLWPTMGDENEIYALGESTRGELVSPISKNHDWQPYLDGISAYELEFSHDQKWVAYVQYPEHRLRVARTDGSASIQLAWPDFEVHQPHWSPDGTRIALMGKHGENWRALMVEVATGRGKEILPDGDDQGVPTWCSNDELVFGDFPTGDPRQVMRLHRIRIEQKSASVLPSSEHLWTARCSPDGKYVAALRQDSKAVLVSDWGSRNWRQILSGELYDDLTWSMDSKHLFLFRAQTRDLVKVDIFTGSVEKLIDVQGFPFAREQWFGIAPDGSPLALRAANAQEIYAIRWQPD